MEIESPKITLLNANNWHTWVKDIQVLLLDRGSWSFIEDTEKEPTGESVTRKEINDYNIRKNRAYTTIYYGIQPQYRNLISETKDGKKAYDILKNYFEPDTKARVITLLDEFFSLRFKSREETIGLFSARLKASVQRLADAGHPLDPLYQSFQMIRYLPPEFNGIIQLIYRWDDTKFKLDNIVEELILEENRLSQLKKDTGNIALGDQGAYGAVYKSSNKSKPISPQHKSSQFKGSKSSSSKGKTKRKKGATCWHCNRRGHLYFQCPEKINKSTVGKQLDAPNVELLCNFADKEQDKLNWCLDSGATNHFTNNKNLFIDYKEIKNTKMALAVDNAESTVIGTGTVGFKVKNGTKVILLTNVMYSPNLRRNLLSMSKIDEAGGYFYSTRGRLWVLNKNSEKLFFAEKEKGLYILKPTYDGINKNELKKCTGDSVNTLLSTNFNPVPANVHTEINDNEIVFKCNNDISTENVTTVKKKNEKLGTSRIDQADVKLWHKRYSHINNEYMVNTSKNNSVVGLPVLEKLESDCIPCKLAKAKRKSFKPIGKIRSKKPLELLHMDLCGRLPDESLNGSVYFLTIIDDYSRKVTVYPLKSKTEVFDTFTRFKTRAENFLDLKVKCIRTDSGLEFCSAAFTKFLNDQGIKHERTNFYSPEQNGVSERYNLTALDSVKAMLHDSGLDNKFWAEALLCFTYTFNRICHKGQQQTPFEKYCSKKPSVAHLRTFGCLAYVGIPKQKRRKLDLRAQIGIMVGYAQQTKGYRVWLKDTGKLIETINVNFNENEFPGGSILDPKNDYLRFRFSEQEMISDDESPIPEKVALTPCTDIDWVRSAVKRSDGSRTDIYYGIEGTNVRIRSPNEAEKYCKTNNISFIREFFDFSTLNPFSGKIKSMTADQSETVESSPDPELHNVEIIPKNYTEALRSPNKEKWQKAMNDEMSIIEQRKVWELVPPPEKNKILGCRWVYTTKTNNSGEIVRFKARLVAQGYKQIRGESFDEIFSPVVNFTLIRLFFTILVCTLGWLHCQLDIKNAYLYADVSYNIYMTQPQGFVDPNKKDYVCLLKKSLYGLHQSGRNFYNKLDKVLKTLNFIKLKWSNCVYLYGDKILLLVYVDDIVVFGKGKIDIDRAIDMLQQKFDLKILGKTKKLLGIEFSENSNNLYLHQGQYITRICENFSQFSSAVSSLPMVRGQLITQKDCPQDKNETTKIPYRNLIGCLSFLATRTRPDICYAVNILSQFQENPGEKHWQLLLKVLGYVKFTRNYKLKLSKIDTFTLNCFSDADFAANRDNRVSMGGMFFMIDNSPISWRTFKHKCVSLSTMESEYISLSEASKELIWIKNIIIECENLGIKLQSANLFCDNKSAIDFAKSPIENNRSKHIDVRYHFLREKVNDNVFELKYISSKNNLADNFTKATTKYNLRNFCDVIFMME